MIPDDPVPAPSRVEAAPSTGPWQPDPSVRSPPAPAPLVRPLEVIAIGTIVVLDQITKFVVKATIPLYAKHVIIPNLLDFTHVQNTGAAFGLLNAADFPYKSAVMIGIADAGAGRDRDLRAAARRATSSCRATGSRSSSAARSAT